MDWMIAFVSVLALDWFDGDSVSDFFQECCYTVVDQPLQSKQIRGGKLCNVFSSKLSLQGGVGTSSSLVNLTLFIPPS